MSADAVPNGSFSGANLKCCSFFAYGVKIWMWLRQTQAASSSLTKTQVWFCLGAETFSRQGVKQSGTNFESFMTDWRRLCGWGLGFDLGKTAENVCLQVHFG